MNIYFKWLNFLSEKNSKVIAVALLCITLFLYFPPITNLIHYDKNRYWLMIYEQMKHPFTPLQVSDPMDHFAKVGLRLIVPIIGFLTPFDDLQSKFAILIIIKLILGYFFYKICFQFLVTKFENRLMSLLITLSLAISYIGSSFVSDYQNFDDFGFFFILIFLVTKSNTAILLSAILGLFSDERTFLPLIIISLYKYSKTTIFNIHNYSIITGVILRLIIGEIFQLHPTVRGGGVQLLDYPLHGNFNYLLLGIFSPFKSFWLLIILYFQYTLRLNLKSIGILFSTVGILIISISVIDITRSLCYAFPLLLIATIEIKRNYDSKLFQYFILILLSVNIISPDFSVCDNVFCSQNFISKIYIHFFHPNDPY
jgi:hypothetical protein